MNQPYWLATAAPPRFPQLDRDLNVDVVVVGGGITGITAAYLLKRQGNSVALLERDQFCHADTGHTTAHVTCVTDLPPSQLIHRFGRDHARAVWDAGLAAIGQIQQNVETLPVECDFRRVPGYLMGSIKPDAPDDSEQVRRETKAVHDLGFDADDVASVPIFGKPAMRVPNQAIFHPVSYLAGLLQAIDQAGSYVFENTEVKEVKDRPLSVTTGQHTIQCKYVVIATHVPLMGKNSIASATLLQSKLALYSTYALGARLPRDLLPQASFWDLSDPYYFIRIHREATYDYVIFGGEDHKTGQVTQTQSHYDQLQAMLMRYFPEASVHRRWSGQVIETYDGLPLIGELSEGQMIATGFAGNGMTFGTLSAMMACDFVQKRKNPWTKLFDPHRTTILGGTWDYVKENVDYPYYMAKDWMTRSEGKSLDDLAPGEAKILKLGGKRVAAYRDERGEVSAVSAICTHMGCVVHWNDAEKTWDCPCHGSRYLPDGHVLAGPAETPLEPVQLKVPQKT